MDYPSQNPTRITAFKWSDFSERQQSRSAFGTVVKRRNALTCCSLGRHGRRRTFLSVVPNAQLNTLAPAADTVLVGVAQRIHAAAVLLLIEVLVLADFDHTR